MFQSPLEFVKQRASLVFSIIAIAASFCAGYYVSNKFSQVDELNGAIERLGEKLAVSEFHNSLLISNAEAAHEQSIRDGKTIATLKKQAASSASASSKATERIHETIDRNCRVDSVSMCLIEAAIDGSDPKRCGAN